MFLMMMMTKTLSRCLLFLFLGIAVGDRNRDDFEKLAASSKAASIGAAGKLIKVKTAKAQAPDEPLPEEAMEARHTAPVTDAKEEPVETETQETSEVKEETDHMALSNPFAPAPDAEVSTKCRHPAKGDCVVLLNEHGAASCTASENVQGECGWSRSPSGEQKCLPKQYESPLDEFQDSDWCCFQNHRGNFTCDAANGRVFEYAPNSGEVLVVTALQQANRGPASLGFVVDSWPNPRSFVESVDTGGWAEQHGVEVGDEILRIDGSDAGALHSKEFFTRMKQRPLTIELLKKSLWHVGDKVKLVGLGEETALNEGKMGNLLSYYNKEWIVLLDDGTLLSYPRVRLAPPDSEDTRAKYSIAAVGQKGNLAAIKQKMRDARTNGIMEVVTFAASFEEGGDTGLRFSSMPWAHNDTTPGGTVPVVGNVLKGTWASEQHMDKGAEIVLINFKAPALIKDKESFRKLWEQRPLHLMIRQESGFRAITKARSSKDAAEEARIQEVRENGLPSPPFAQERAAKRAERMEVGCRGEVTEDGGCSEMAYTAGLKNPGAKGNLDILKSNAGLLRQEIMKGLNEPNWVGGLAQYRNYFNTFDKLRTRLDYEKKELEKAMADAIHDDNEDVKLFAQGLLPKLDELIKQVEEDEEASKTLSVFEASLKNLRDETKLVDENQQSLILDELQLQVLAEVQRLILSESVDSGKHNQEAYGLDPGVHVRARYGLEALGARGNLEKLMSIVESLREGMSNYDLHLPSTVVEMGTTVRADSAGRLKITKVEAGSWADKAGIREGAEIVRLDGKPTTNMGVQEFNDILRESAEHKLGLREDHKMAGLLRERAVQEEEKVLEAAEDEDPALVHKMEKRLQKEGHWLLSQREAAMRTHKDIRRILAEEEAFYRTMLIKAHFGGKIPEVAFITPGDRKVVVEGGIVTTQNIEAEEKAELLSIPNLPESKESLKDAKAGLSSSTRLLFEDVNGDLADQEADRRKEERRKNDPKTAGDLENQAQAQLTTLVGGEIPDSDNGDQHLVLGASDDPPPNVLNGPTHGGQAGEEEIAAYVPAEPYKGKPNALPTNYSGLKECGEHLQKVLATAGDSVVDASEGAKSTVKNLQALAPNVKELRKGLGDFHAAQKDLRIGVHKKQVAGIDEVRQRLEKNISPEVVQAARLRSERARRAVTYDADGNEILPDAEQVAILEETQNKWWEELSGTQHNDLRLLGWSQASWDRDMTVPQTMNHPWDDLTASQQEAARRLGWDRPSWEAENYRPKPGTKQTEAAPTNAAETEEALEQERQRHKAHNFILAGHQQAKVEGFVTPQDEEESREVPMEDEGTGSPSEDDVSSGVSGGDLVAEQQQLAEDQEELAEHKREADQSTSGSEEGASDLVEDEDEPTSNAGSDEQDPANVDEDDATGA